MQNMTKEKAINWNSNEQRNIAKSMKPGETTWVGETRASVKDGDPGSVYGVRRLDVGWEIVESPKDRRGLSFPVESHPTYIECWKAARELITMIYR